MKPAVRIGVGLAAVGLVAGSVVVLTNDDPDNTPKAAANSTAPASADADGKRRFIAAIQKAGWSHYEVRTTNSGYYARVRSRPTCDLKLTWHSEGYFTLDGIFTGVLADEIKEVDGGGKNPDVALSQEITGKVDPECKTLELDFY